MKKGITIIPIWTRNILLHGAQGTVDQETGKAKYVLLQQGRMQSTQM